MSNRNDAESSMVWLAFAAVAMVGFFLFFVAALVSLALTIACIFAWNEEREFFGQKFTPYEARHFIGFGIVGAFVVGGFGAILYHNHMLEPELRPWMTIAGYVIGSLGWGMYYAKYEYVEEASLAPNMRNVTPPNEECASDEPVSKRKSFEYADWED